MEHLFSTVRLYLTDLKKSLFPIMFEVLLFLNLNRNFWEISSVSLAQEATTAEASEHNLDDDC